MPDRTCSIPGCDRPHSGRGWCNLHYQRWLLKGDPLASVRQPNTAGRCAVQDCDRPLRSTGADYCDTHYFRWYRTGDPCDRPVGGSWGHSHGYRVVHRPGHLLADQRGDVYEHRLVLFDHIGYGPHLCRWCSKPINWRLDLEADHLDQQRDHNTPDNLVPACHRCNVLRTRDRDPVSGRLTANGSKGGSHDRARAQAQRDSRSTFHETIDTHPQG